VDDVICHTEPDGGIGYTVRTEELVRVAAMLAVSRSLLADHPHGMELAQQQLRDELRQCMERLGRVQWGEATITVDEDIMRNLLVCRADVLTRESDEGEWRSIWAAVREDRAALREGAD
jgi:hypothetical protein